MADRDVLPAVRAQLDRLLATTRVVAGSLDPRTVLSTIVETATELLGADSGDILLWDRSADVLRVVAVSDFPPEMLGFETPFGTGLSSQAILAQRTIEVEDYRAYEHRLRALDHYDFGSVLCSPLLVRGEAIGALNVHARGRRLRFPSGSADLLDAFAGHAAIAIDHARRYDNEVALGRELARANRELTRLLTMQQRLAEHVVADGDLAGIATLLAEDLGRAVVIEDHLHRTIASAVPGGGPAGTSGDGADGRTGVPLRVGGDVAGFLVLADGASLDPVDRALIDAAATGAALAFARRHAALEVEDRLRGEAIADLLAGTYPSEAAIAARAARLGHDLDRPHRPLVVRLDAAGDEEAARRALDSARANLVGRTPRAGVVAQAGQLVIVLAEGGSGPPTAGTPPDVLAAADELRDQVASVLGGAMPTVAIGERCIRPDDYERATRAARDAAALVVHLGRAGSVVDVAALGSERLLLQVSSRQDLEAYVRATLGPLLDPARSELLRTLRVHLAVGGNQRRTAERCVVHVNTVADRVRRIERLLGRDLADPATTFDLTLALRISDLAASGVTDGPAGLR